MTHYKSMYEKSMIGAWDLPQGRDVVVTISKVEAQKISNGTKSTKKPVLYFEGKEKGLILNATNGKAIAGMYGVQVEDWVGKKIAIFGTTTGFGSETVECVRVRPQIPQDRQARPVNDEAAQ